MISDLCDPNPCQNGGTCNLGNCQCAEGYTGAMCEIGTLDYRIKVPVLWKKNHPKIVAIRNFFCGTFEVYTKFSVAVLLFHYPYFTAKASLEVHGSQLPKLDTYKCSFLVSVYAKYTF